MTTLTSGLLEMDITSDVADDDHDRSDMEEEFATAHRNLEDDVAAEDVAEAATIPVPSVVNKEEDHLPSDSVVTPEVPSVVADDDHPDSDTTVTPEVPSDAEDDPSTSWADAVDVADDGGLAVSSPFTMSAQLPLDDEPCPSIDLGHLAPTEEDPGEKSLDMLDVLFALPRPRMLNMAVRLPNPLPTLPMTSRPRIVISSSFVRFFVVYGVIRACLRSFSFVFRLVFCLL